MNTTPEHPDADFQDSDTTAPRPDTLATATEASADAAPSAGAALDGAAAAPDQPVPAPKGPPDLAPAQCAAKLAELFPALFAPGDAPKPLKLRIQADIQQRAPGIFTKRSLSIFLSRYTTGNAYIRALVAAPHRFDLDGQPAGEISEVHLAAAKEELERRRAIQAERRAAEREARNAQRRRPPADAPRHRAQEHREHAQQGTAPPRRKPLPDAQRAPRRREHPPGHGAAPVAAARPAAPERLPEDPARRERAMLLRSWESSSLTKANFCVLKRLSEQAFDAQIELAQKERAERTPH